MEQEMPYFMKNPKWYYHDAKEFCYKLTDEAPPKAVESYKEFYEVHVSIDENGDEWIED